MEKTPPEYDHWQKLILNHVLDGLLLVKADTRQVVTANSIALRMLDQSIDAVVGHEVHHFLVEQGPQEVKNGGEQPGQYHPGFLITKAGSRIPIIKKTVQTTHENNPYLIESFIPIAKIKAVETLENGQRKLAEALHETSKALNQSLDLREVLDLILDYTGKVVPYDAANLMLVEDGTARITACRGYERLGGADRVMEQVRVIAEVPNLSRMAESGQPIVVTDTRLSSDWVNFSTSVWIHSYVSAPICNKGQTIGFLNLNIATPGFYQPVHAERLLAFASQAAIAIENARLFQSAQKEIADRRRIEVALQEAKNELEARVVQRTQELTLELKRRQQAEADLEKERTRLALRVEERTVELSKANAELARSARMKDAFLASMSHELRTPLNAILNISESLQELVYGELNSAQTRSVHMIEESGRHLLTLINDILDLSKIGAGKFELVQDYVEVAALCEASLKLVEELSRKKRLIVSFSHDPQVKTVWADQRRLKQVLVNLLSNSIKFTPPGGSIALMVVADVEKQQARFVVSDTGIGISEEGIKQLFKPFVQLDNSLARQFEGTGLGLALAYHIIELHGGGVAVDSEVGKGSQFIVSLKWMPESMDKKTITAERGGAARLGDGAEEDPAFDPILRIGRYLNELGIELQSKWISRDQLVAQDEVNTQEGLLIIDGCLLPRGNEGENVLRLVGKAHIWPVIIVTGAEGGGAGGHLPGNVGFITSPFDRKDLRTVIKKTSPDGTASLIRKAVILRERAPTASQDQGLILIVDDNETSLHVAGEYLLAKGFRVQLACNGMEAIKYAQDGATPDLIFMDIQMPGIDGLEAIRRIRADERGQHIPIVALTALAMPADRALCLAAGANDYLSKPIGLNELVDVIQKYVHHKANE